MAGGERGLRAWIGPAGLLVVGVAVGASVGRWSVAPTDAETRDRELRAEVAAIRTEVRRVSGQSSRVIAAAEVPPSSGVRAATTPYTPEDLQLMSEADGAARASAAEAAMQIGPRDPSQEARITAALGRYGPRDGEEMPTLSSVECASGICRMEFTHADAEAVQAMAASLMAHPGLSGAGLAVRRNVPDGYVTVFFVSQSQARLPRAAAP